MGNRRRVKAVDPDKVQERIHELEEAADKSVEKKGILTDKAIEKRAQARLLRTQTRGSGRTALIRQILIANPDATIDEIAAQVYGESTRQTKASARTLVSRVRVELKAVELAAEQIHGRAS